MRSTFNYVNAARQTSPTRDRFIRVKVTLNTYSLPLSIGLANEVSAGLSQQPNFKLIPCHFGR